MYIVKLAALAALSASLACFSGASAQTAPDAKGVPMLSLARANKLGLKVRSSVLLSAEVIEKFEWDKP